MEKFSSSDMGKVILANQIAVFLNQLYLQNKIKKIA